MASDPAPEPGVDSKAPACPAPDPAPHGPTRFAVLPGAVDTHAHVIGLPPRYPFVEARSYTPPEATPQAYLHMLDATGMTFGVLVQVSVHGTDNRLMVETLKANPQRLKGICVVPLCLPDASYDALKEAGVVGLRLNVLYGGGIGFEEVDRYGALARELGWHLQFLVDAKDLTPMASRLARLPVPFVVDHMGHFPTSRGTEDQGFQTLVSLVRDGLGQAVRSLPADSGRTALPRHHSLRADAPRGRTGPLRLGFRLAACLELGDDDECRRPAGPARRLGSGRRGAEQGARGQSGPPVRIPRSGIITGIPRVGAEPPNVAAVHFENRPIGEQPPRPSLAALK